MSIEDKLCGRCWGRGVVGPYPGSTSPVCPRCKGTGEEPDSFDWRVVALMLVILVIGLFLIWSIPHG